MNRSYWWAIVAAVIAAYLFVFRQQSAADSTATDQAAADVGTQISDSIDGVVSRGTYSMFGLPDDVSQLIEQYATQYGVDPNLAKAQAWAESRGKQSARSPVGAIGVFQLMPSTAAGLGVDPANEEQNIEGGIRYLSQLLNSYGGDVRLALAAYNAGPGNVRKYGGVPPFPETQKYVAEIMDMAGIQG